MCRKGRTRIWHPRESRFSQKRARRRQFQGEKGRVTYTEMIQRIREREWMNEWREEFDHYNSSKIGRNNFYFMNWTTLEWRREIPIFMTFQNMISLSLKKNKWKKPSQHFSSCRFLLLLKILSFWIKCKSYKLAIHFHVCNVNVFGVADLTIANEKQNSKVDSIRSAWFSHSVTLFHNFQLRKVYSLIILVYPLGRFNVQIK